MAKDAYQMAREWGCTPHDAALRMEREGWAFAGYNGAGQADYKPPATMKEITSFEEFKAAVAEFVPFSGSSVELREVKAAFRPINAAICGSKEFGVPAMPGLFPALSDECDAAIAAYQAAYTRLRLVTLEAA